jgi:Mg/Co/Ni transporter MgtE
MVRKRAGWLVFLFLGEMLTATAMGFFEKEIARAVVLALFVPLIISSGGNSGSQASTLVIRALAVGELRLTDVFRVVRRELFSGFALGCILRDRFLADLDLVRILEHLRIPLAARRIHGGIRTCRGGAMGIVGRFDSALHASETRLRPGDLIGAVIFECKRCKIW